MISDTALDAYIRTWKLARIGKDISGLTYPTRNILHPEWGVGTQGAVLSQAIHDAELVQRTVASMPPEIKSAFEAYHLDIIRQEFCGRLPHEGRANTLGIPKSTYFRRVKFGRELIRNDLTDRTKEGKLCEAITTD